MLAERLTAQMLAGAPAQDPLAVAERLLAIQAQDPRGARLAIRARSQGLSAADVDRALSEDHSLVIDSLCRGTLHLVRAEDHGWLHALTTPPLITGNARRLEQEGVSEAAAERGVAVIEHALTDEGPLTRHQLRERIDRAGIPTAGQALVHLLMLACLRGIAFRGPMIGREHAYALARDWLPPAPPRERGQALAELARRYLAGHGPAEDRDLARWAGLPLRDARAGLKAIASELSDGAGALVDLRRRPAAAELPAPRLLGAFEPLIVGWRSRDFVLGGREPSVVSGGVFRPVALVGGHAVAVWSVRGGEIELKPFGRLGAADRNALDLDATAVIHYLSGENPSDGAQAR